MAFARSREPGPLSLLYRPVVKLSSAARRSQFSMVWYLEWRLEFHQNPKISLLSLLLKSSRHQQDIECPA